MEARKVYVVCFLVLGLSLGFIFGAGAQQESTTLTFGLMKDPPTLDPHLGGGCSARTVKMQVYEGLVSYSPSGDVIPQLAKSFEILDPTTYVFHLREGVKFHNGAELTSEDVAYSFRRILDPDIGALLMAPFSIIEEIETPDAYTVVFRLKGPYSPGLGLFSRAAAAIVCKPWMETEPEFNRQMMGTGPFRFVRRVPGSEFQLVRNEDYYIEGLPKSDKLRFLVLADVDARLAALQTREVDIIEYVEWRHMATVEADPNLVLETTAGPFQLLSINVSYEPFQDPRVRRAISYAINREEISEACFEGRATPIYGGLIPEGSWAYNEDLANYFEYNPEKAKQLLEEAGYAEGFSCTLLVAAGITMHRCPAEIVQAQLGQIGIDVELELVDWPTRVESRSKWNYQFASDGLGANLPDPDFYYVYFYSKGPKYCRPPYFDDAEVNRLLDEGRTSLDREERKRIYHELEKRLLDLSPWIFLVSRAQGYAYGADVHGFHELQGLLVFQSGINIKHAWVSE